MNSSELLPSRALPPWRTRRNVKQSKNGCYTCKSRRVKCDETQPHCLRCTRAGQKCAGYPESKQYQFISRKSSKSSSLFIQAQDFSASYVHLAGNTALMSSIELRLANLGLTVLLQGRHQVRSWGLSNHWLYLLAHSFATSEAPSQAVVYLGAVCESLMDSKSRPQCLSLARRYQNALSAMRKGVSLLSDGPVSIFLTSVVLTAAMVLLRHLEDALLYMKGALGSLNLLGKQIGEPDATMPTSYSGELYQHLHSTALALDMQTAWYRLGQPSEIPPIYKPTAELPDVFAMSDLDIATLLHDCYHFTASVYKFKYKPSHEIPVSLVLEQSRLIATLRSYLKIVPESTLFEDYKTPTDTNHSLLTRATQCLSTLIFLSIVLQPYECVYDSFNPEFLRIVQIAEELLSKDKFEAHEQRIPNLQIQPGIFQPLFFTATKCRQPKIRRRALNALESLDLEGPWDPHILSTIVRRAISIEENTHHYMMKSADSSSCIVERDRLSGCGIHDISSGVVRASFSRCLDIEQMLSVPEPEQQQFWELWHEDLNI